MMAYRMMMMMTVFPRARPLSHMYPDRCLAIPGHRSVDLLELQEITGRPERVGTRGVDRDLTNGVVRYSTRARAAPTILKPRR